MDSPSSTRSSPSKALNPLSPERMNQQASSNSPSSLSDALRHQRKPHHRGISDVQSKVAFLNNLSRGGSPGAGAGSTSAGGAAALQRAILGREEAETALSHVSSQLSDAQSRERRISERLESLLEELQTAKERKAHERIVFEKEIRKARKEAFRAGSILVKTQEELKHTRAEAKGLKDEVESEREAKENAKQEAFERAYTIAGLTEELEELKGRLRTAEATNDAITLQRAREQELKRQDIGRMSLAEGDLSLIMTPSPRKPKRPADDTDDDFWTSTDPAVNHDTPSKRPRLSDIAPPLDGYYYPTPESIEELVEYMEANLKYERQARRKAEELVEFCKVSCMFEACDCRIREREENAARAKKLAAQQKSQEQLEEHEHKNREIACGEKNAPRDAIQGPLETDVREEEVQEAEVQGKEAQKEFLEELQEEQVQEGRVEEEEVEEEEVEEEEVEEEEVEEEEVEEEEEEVAEPLITFSPVTGTFRSIPSPTRQSPQKQAQNPVPLDLQPSAPRSQSELEAQPEFVSSVPKYESHPRETASKAIPQSEAYSRDLTPAAHDPPMTAEVQRQMEHPNMGTVEHANEIHNVKRIPLRTGDEASNSFAGVPGTPISREQALAQIRARRGRTSAIKRSVSANDAGFRAGGLHVTPVRAARRIPAVQHSDPQGDGVMRNRRDMSAPLRMFR
ncbi:hypothetical protein BDW59DRAFT_147875 [Aspergillus cavernicola]|uniref:Uncharacterized protein n=1 Tax=Aspergillus cavernicola TaxID=176166 RepID=A0ABR4IB90_9EURO